MIRWLAAALCLVALPATASAQTHPEAGQGWWAFAPAVDTFDARSELDLRSLNESVAGAHGLIRLSPDGDSFVRGDDQPIRFWGGTVDATGAHADIDRQARFLAKRGVNMVRWHGNLMPSDRRDSQLGDVNAASLDQAFYLVAAMKTQGVYLTLSPYWAFFDRMHGADGKRAQPNWPVPRNPDADTTTGLLFFEPEMIAAYKGWLKALMTRINPYTSIALKDDPAVAILQIQNEDSLLFWTFNDIRGADRDELERQFGTWLTARYGSLAATETAWHNAKAGGAPNSDRPGAGMMALPNIYELTKVPGGDAGQARRYADTTEFLTTTMRNFNADIVAYLRNELGVRQLVNAGNWRPASMERLADAERFSYTTTDVLAVNRYVTGVHTGSDTTGWAVKAGDRFTDVSVLTDVGTFPLAIKQVAHHPMLVTESLWVPPTSYESEGPFLVSAMQALSGVDGFYWFSLGSGTTWDQPRSANGHLPSVGKWVANSPMTLGQFPAAALMYRQGYVHAAKQPAVFEHRPLADLWQRKTPLITEEAGFDPNRDATATARTGGGLSPLAYLAGPVQVDYGATGTNTVDLTAHVDPQTKTVTGLTGETRWDFGKGVAQVDTPKAQGVTGFLTAGGKTFRLSDVTIVSDNAYAAILIVSLDGRPIRTSRKLLIQMGTQARPSGWIDKAATWTEDGKTVTGHEIVNHGHAPWLVADAQAQVRINNAGLTSATALDANGMPICAVSLKRSREAVRLDLPRDSLYVIVERK